MSIWMRHVDFQSLDKFHSNSFTWFFFSSPAFMLFLLMNGSIIACIARVLLAWLSSLQNDVSKVARMNEPLINTRSLKDSETSPQISTWSIFFYICDVRPFTLVRAAWSSNPILLQKSSLDVMSYKMPHTWNLTLWDLTRNSEWKCHKKREKKKAKCEFHWRRHCRRL